MFSYNFVVLSGLTAHRQPLEDLTAENGTPCCVCFVDLGQIYLTWFQLDNFLHVPDFATIDLVNGANCGAGVHYYLSVGALSCIGTVSRTDDIFTTRPCLDKYIDTYSNRVDLYNDCSTCSVLEAPTCPPCPNCLRTSPSDSSVTGKSFEIHPNPATDRLIVDGNLANTQVLIRNAFGQVLFNSRITSLPFEIDTENLPSGIYLIEVRGEKVRKFIKL